MTPETVDQMNLDKSFAFYKDRFSDASDFTFVFVGSFDVDTMKPLVDAVSGVAAGDPSQGNVEGHRDQEADRRDREAGGQGNRTEEPRRNRVLGSVRVQPGSARGDPGDGAGARDAPQRIAARGSRRHLQRLGVRRIFEDPARGVHRHDRIWLQPGSHRRTGQERVQGDRTAEDRTGRPTSRSPTSRKRSCAIRKPT